MLLFFLSIPIPLPLGNVASDFHEVMSLQMVVHQSPDPLEHQSLSIKVEQSVDTGVGPSTIWESNEVVPHPNRVGISKRSLTKQGSVDQMDVEQKNPQSLRTSEICGDTKPIQETQSLQGRRYKVVMDTEVVAKAFVEANVPNVCSSM